MLRFPRIGREDVGLWNDDEGHGANRGACSPSWPGVCTSRMSESSAELLTSDGERRLAGMFNAGDSGRGGSMLARVGDLSRNY